MTSLLNSLIGSYCIPHYTNYDNVCHFMTVFGQDVLKKIDISKINSDKSLHKFRFSLINEEFKETISALGCDVDSFPARITDCIQEEDVDVVEFADGVGDLLVVIYGTMASFGLNQYLNIDYHNNFEFVKNTVYGVNTQSTEEGEEEYIKVKFENKIYTNSNKIIETLHRMNELIEKYNNYIETMLTDRYTYTYSFINIINDLLYYTYLLGFYAGFNVDEIFNLVHESNMSKLCNSEQNAIDTISEKYTNHNLYKNVKYRKQGEYYVVYNELDNGNFKILKSKDFFEPEIKEYLYEDES